MTSNPGTWLEHLLRSNDLEWLIAGYPGHAIDYFLGHMQQASEISRQRFGDAGPQFNEGTLTGEFQANPYRVRSFLQALGATRSPAMLLMAWRILQGSRIHAVEMRYQERRSFFLRFVLRPGSRGDGKEEIYESVDIADAAVLRHLGIVEMTDGPVFEGFYPLSVSRHQNVSTSS